MADLSVADVAARVNARIADLARALLGEPNRVLSTATQLRFGNKGSVAVEIDGPNAGKWFDHEHGVGGDGLELIRHRERRCLRLGTQMAGPAASCNAKREITQADQKSGR
jgi:hypothetical protein